MTIDITHDGTTAKWPDCEPAELCCFCWKPTRYWHTPKDVPVCQGCAQAHEADEVPTKSVWIAEERRRLPRRIMDCA